MQERNALENFDRRCNRPERSTACIEIPRQSRLAKVERINRPRPSQDETNKRCLALLGRSVTSRDFDRQVAELQIRAAVLNGDTALGIPIAEPVGQVVPGKGNSDLQLLCTPKSARTLRLPGPFNDLFGLNLAWKRVDMTIHSHDEDIFWLGGTATSWKL